MELDNHDDVKSWTVESRVRGEWWLVLVLAVVLHFALDYVEPAQAEVVEVTPRVAQLLGWCEGVEK